MPQLLDFPTVKEEPWEVLFMGVRKINLCDAPFGNGGQLGEGHSLHQLPSR